MIDIIEKAYESVADYIDATPGYSILFPILIGIVIAWTVYIVKCAQYGAFFHELKKRNINSPDNAVKPEELGIKVGKTLAKSLKKEGAGLRTTVDMTEDGRVYLTDEKRSKAIYDSKEVTPAALFLQILALIALIFLLMKAVPIIVEYFQDLKN